MTQVQPCSEPVHHRGICLDGLRLGHKRCPPLEGTDLSVRCLVRSGTVSPAMFDYAARSCGRRPTVGLPPRRGSRLAVGPSAIRLSKWAGTEPEWWL